MMGGASHLGPVWTRNARRLLSTQTQTTIHQLRWQICSISDCDGDYDVHVCRHTTKATRVAVIVPLAPKKIAIDISQFI